MRTRKSYRRRVWAQRIMLVLLLAVVATPVSYTHLDVYKRQPLHIDVDFGIDRIEPRYRKPYIQPKSYDEILEDLTPLNVKDFDTLVFDTGGKLISLMSQWAIKKDVKYGQRDGSLSLKGYGFIGREFQRLMDYCFYELDKHIVVAVSYTHLHYYYICQKKRMEKSCDKATVRRDTIEREVARATSRSMVSRRTVALSQDFSIRFFWQM